MRTLDALLAVMDLGVTRCGATATSTILDDFRARAAGATPEPAAAAAAGGRRGRLLIVTHDARRSPG